MLTGGAASRGARWISFAGLLALAACGGGGGGAAPAGPAPIVVLGLVSGTQPTTVPQAFRNPLAVAAVVTQTTAASSRFRVPAASLPVSVAAGAEVVLPVVFTPQGVGTVQGSVTLVFTSGAQAADLSQEFEAEAEGVVWGVTPGTLDFGDVLPGATAERSAVVTNQSTLSPVTLTTAALPGAEMTLVAPALPVVVAPGASRTVTVRYAPSGDGGDTGTLSLGLGDAGGPVRIDLTGNTANREQVTDFGTRGFTLQNGAFETATLQVDVPADAISLCLEAVGGTGDTLGLGLLTGPGNKEYENASLTGAYIWNAGAEVFSATLPNTDRTNVQLVPGGGTYAFRIRRMGGSGTSAAVRAIVERRAGGTTSTGTLDLNVWLAQGLSVDAATAAGDATLQAVLARIDTILSAQGIRLGAIDYYDVNDATYDFVTEAEFPGMLRLSAAATETRLNLFFVREALGGGVVGVAGTIDGPKRNGSGVSGVMSVYEGFTTNTIGLVAAHEIGHYLGLYHPVEQTGSFDFIDDTAQCPVSGTNGTCPTPGNSYLMHWQAIGGTVITNGQAKVIRGHATMGPGTLPVAPKPGSGAATLVLTVDDVADLERLPSRWCGTCAHGGDDVTKPIR